MSEQKTVREWGEELLPEPYKSQFMDNLDIPECYATPDRHVSSLYDAIDNFTWRNSPQGHDYWLDIANKIEYGLPIISPRQQSEALLIEFMEFFNSEYQSPIPIRPDDIDNFLNQKYGA